MQPVTIKNNHWIHALWWVQAALLLTLVATTAMAWWTGRWWLLVVVGTLLMAALWHNHRTIQQQKTLQFHWTARGHRSYREAQTGPSAGPLGGFEVAAWWALPGLLCLRLQCEHRRQAVHLTVPRKCLGPAHFSNLWVHISATAEQPTTST
ncbi:DUF4191 domain-containing protein [Marinicella meishanensis]|uniref:DUF4191 domain-containing protein n=1 Tax=Marinicella meishanensis TaxID=2873263 RepID=UPI001CC0027D|nr:DUF4191 domain-containing protein [Marinicella sp. NBU2979]